MLFPDNRELTDMARMLSIKTFGIFPDIPFSFNSRLKRVLGRLVYSKKQSGFEPVRIEISALIFDKERLLEKTLLHELSHLYLMINERDFTHGSRDFRELSVELGFDVKISCDELPVHKWTCSSCGRVVAISFIKKKRNGLSFCCHAPINYASK